MSPKERSMGRVFESSVEIDRPAEAVFAVFSDVAGWPSWTESITSVDLLDDGPLRVGSRAKIRQPRLPMATWTVTELVPGRSFSWEARGPGVRSVGRHEVEPRNTGSTARSILEQHGPLGVIMGTIYAGLTRRYLAMESAGLKARCEQT
jgi:uncharacterized membrane protein